MRLPFRRQQNGRRWIVNVKGPGGGEARFEVTAASDVEAELEAGRRYRLRTGLRGRTVAIREIP